MLPPSIANDGGLVGLWAALAAGPALGGLAGWLLARRERPGGEVEGVESAVTPDRIPAPQRAPAKDRPRRAA